MTWGFSAPISTQSVNINQQKVLLGRPVFDHYQGWGCNKGICWCERNVGLRLGTAGGGRLGAPEEVGPVSSFDAALSGFCQDMIETMRLHHGIGLATVQVGRAERILVVDVPTQSRKFVSGLDQQELLQRTQEESGRYLGHAGPICLINPEVQYLSGTRVKIREGCLSVPGRCVDIVRPRYIRVKYQTVNGHWRELRAKDLLAGVYCRCDHLDGILLVDYEQNGAVAEPGGCMKI